MSVTSVDKDFDNLVITLTADFEAPVERVWELWEDPRKLERWWGPPSHPATFEKHEFREGGDVAYYMTGPDGSKYRGWWRIDALDSPNSIEFTDGFADSDGNPVDDMPVSKVTITITATESGARMELRSKAASREEMERLVEMGAAQGLEESVNQIDALLAE